MHPSHKLAAKSIRFQRLTFQSPCIPKSRKKMKLNAALFSLSCMLLACSSSASSLRGNTRSLKSSSVLCRMILVDTLFEDDASDEFIREEETSCVPVLDGVESDHLVPLDLPESVMSEYGRQLEDGILFVDVSDASVEGSDLILSPSSVISVAQEDEERVRRLQQTSVTQGTLSVAIVRISTLDSPNANSATDLGAMFDTNSINFVTQYDRCSMGKLNFERVNSNAGVFEVTVNGYISSYGTGPGLLVDAAQIQLQQQLSIGSVSELADKVFMCLPSGTGNWVASAGMNHWRAQYNEGWCTSLTATMHEMGHSIGLLHSNKDFVKYADRTGYMAKGYRNPDWPLRCFNGQNNHHLGWYDERKVTIDPFSGGSQVIDLATFVDYDKTSSDQPVLVSLSDKIFLQYNRAKTFNDGTGEMPDEVTIVTEPQDGGSQLIGGLSQGNFFTQGNFALSGRTLYIKACQRVDGDATAPDIMRISISVDQMPNCAAAPARGNNNSPGTTVTIPPPQTTQPPPQTTQPPPQTTRPPTHGRPPASIPNFTDLNQTNPPPATTNPPASTTSPPPGDDSNLSVLDWIRIWASRSGSAP